MDAAARELDEEENVVAAQAAARWVESRGARRVIVAALVGARETV
jgi:aryl-alcohol dehydrogenase-like predicted oxidoreductase